MIYFLHIPKTAGTTLYSFVASQFRPEQVSLTYSGELALWRPNKKYIARLLAEDRAVRVVYGHYSFGVHLLLQDYNPRYVCFMRHPVSRILSFFSHQAREPRSRLYTAIQGGLSIADLIRGHLAPEVNNYVTRILAVNPKLVSTLMCLPGSNSAGSAGAADHLPHPIQVASGCLNGLSHSDAGPYDQIFNRIHLSTALRNLETHFCFVGISERMTESMVRLGKGLGWSSAPPSEHLNTSPIRHPALDEKTKALIYDYNGLDFELYNRCSESWFERF